MFTIRSSGGLLACLVAIALVLPFAHPAVCPMYAHDAGAAHGSHHAAVMSGTDAATGVVTATADAVDSCGDMLDCGIAPVAPVIQVRATVPLGAVRHTDVLPGADAADENTPAPHTPPPRA